jgi:signal transduction histidine kinase
VGTVSGFATSVGRPEPERLELARLYLGYAASAIERERLLSEVSRRNRVLESLRGMLETLAGPERVEGGLGVSLLALAQGLGADAVAVLVEEGEALLFRATIDGDGWMPDGVPVLLRSAASTVLADRENGHARLVSPDVAAVPLRLPEGRAALVAHWPSGVAASGDTLELLDDATRSLALAMEGEALERARRETAALRRSQAIQRELLSWLSHELRTPLTAIQGYASTLCQTDLTWDAESTERFLHSIAAESARLERLVGALLDSSAIESGILRLQGHWCDLRLVLDAAVACVRDQEAITVRMRDELEPVWGDHDRLEQVLVNLLENAVTHGASDRGVEAILRRGAIPGTVEIEVRDHGPGIPAALAQRIFEPRVRGVTDRAGAGLGLSIAKGIVEAHGGMLAAVPVAPGASFVVTLPAEPPADAAEGQPDPSWALVDEAKAADVV